MKQEAKVLVNSLAEFVRRALRKALGTPQEPSWMRYAALVETGDPQSSRSIDEIVYGHED